VDLDALEAEARARLPRMVFDYFAGGADDERTLAANREAFARVDLRPRVLVDVRERDLGTTVLGQRIGLPVAVAPMAYQRLAHPDGELAVARAAGAVGAPMIVSTFSTASVAEVAAVARAPVWFQLYVLTDRGATRALIERAEAAGATALVVTVDAPVLGHRRRDVANRFALPAGLRLGNLEGLSVAGAPHDVEGSALAAHFSMLVDAGLTWSDLSWLRVATRLPIVLKGIITKEDARLASDHGAQAIVVSNHGGRQLDEAPATLDVLAEVVDAVNGAATADGPAEVWMDGGVRRGTDVVKALALGAKLVLLGRPVLWGLAAGGEDGVMRVLRSLQGELDLALALCGCRGVTDVGRGHVGVRAIDSRR